MHYLAKFCLVLANQLEQYNSVLNNIRVDIINNRINGIPTHMHTTSEIRLVKAGNQEHAEKIANEYFDRMVQDQWKGWVLFMLDVTPEIV